jgi:hypothetical protein
VEDGREGATAAARPPAGGALSSAAPASPTTFDGILRRIAHVEAQPMLAPGQILDDAYELLERIGGGGMGVVFRARDLRLGRQVAVKVLKRRDADEHLRRLFEREARATAQLLHPNIVTLHHVGAADGELFLVLELLVGETLAARLARRGGLPLAEALPIVDAVLAALTFAHERGVLHRDLKPTNVFITGDERIKVLDFGVALSLDTDPGPVTRAAGTPGYMAPEQRDGGAQDARTDVWAAALLLVECLAGRRPDEAHADAALGELTLPGELRRVLAGALASDPARRPGSAAELRVALQRAGGQLAPAVGGARRGRGRARLAALVVAAAAVGGGATWIGLRRGPAVGAPSNAEVSGAWDVNFGNLRLKVDADGTAYGVYEHDDGILVGRYTDGTFTGRWCELPTRRGPADAGPVELHVTRSVTRMMIEGRWRYGDAPDAQWQTDFYGFSVPTASPAALELRLQRHEPCP